MGFFPLSTPPGWDGGGGRGGGRGGGQRKESTLKVLISKYSLAVILINLSITCIDILIKFVSMLYDRTCWP